MKPLLTLSLIILFSLPMLVSAQGVIPCGGPGQEPCQACHLVKLGQNLLDWFITISASIIALVFTIGGFKMVMSKGSEGGVSEAKGMMTNAVVGLIILLSAWLIVDTVLKLVVDETKLGVWNEIQCVVQPKKVPDVYATLPPDTGRPVVGGGTVGTLTPSQMAARLAATAAYKNQLCAGVDVQTCNSLQAIMSIESAGVPTAQSPYATGLMQLTPSTARTLDPSLSGLSDADVKAKLLDPTYNMKLGSQLYSKLLQQNSGDVSKTYAAYNGGQGANGPSNDCPGQLKWQCVWDSPGCYGTSKTDCTPNIGYKETRNYVGNVNAVRCSIQGATGC